MAPVFIAGVQGLLDQQAAKTGAVDEQVALDHLPVFQHQRLDKATVGMLAHLLDLALDAGGAIALRVGAQEARIQAGIQMVGIVHRGLLQHREAVRTRGLRFQAVLIEAAVHATPLRLQPEVMERAHQRALPGTAKRVDVAITLALPVFEGNGQLEGAGHRTQEFLLVDLQEAMKSTNRWHGGFAHANRADLLRLHQHDLEQPAKLMRQRRGGNPPGGATAGNDNLANA